MPINSPDVFNPVGDATVAGGGGGSDISIKEEGVELTSAVTSIDFTGKGSTASAVGSAVTVNSPASVFQVNFSFFDNTIRNVYIPLVGETETTNIQRYNRFVIPIACKLKKVIMLITSDQTAGTLPLDLQIGDLATPGVSIENVTVGGGGVNTVYTWNYSTNSLAIGDIVALFLTGGGAVAIANVTGTAYFELT